MHRRWWSILVPVVSFLFPVHNAAALSTVPQNLNSFGKESRRIFDLKYYFSFRGYKSGDHIYSVEHGSHASHRSHASHASHSSHVSSSGAFPSYPSTPRIVPAVPSSPVTIRGRVIADANIRTLPSGTGGIVAVARKGQIVNILQYSTNGWIRVTYIDFDKVVTGWMSAEYVGNL